MSRFPILFCSLSLILLSCGDNTQVEPSKEQKEESVDRISGIAISEFGRTTNLIMDYKDNGTVSIAFSPSNGKNIDARIEYNDKNNLMEVVSGKNRLQYLYAEGGKRIGIIEGSGQSQIMFDYDGDNLIAQYIILGNDTVGNYQYQYEDGVPSSVEIHGAGDYFRAYVLTYSDVPNSLANFYEMVFPSDLTGQLGIPALYGKFYLEKAIRVDPGAAKTPELQESYVPKQSEIIFEIKDSGKQETVKLISDGTRQWSTVIDW